jgi:hypothetical protein
LRPVLIVNPRADLAFHEAVVAAVTDDQAPEDLQRLLRDRYPSAVVRPRSLSDERVVVWYVYREGRWIPDGPSEGSGA